jgi:sodium pump decarboxylase gamma subunit
MTTVIAQQPMILPQAFVLLVAGMLIVFVFLYVMVLVMRGVALVVPRFNHLLPDDAPKAVARPVAVRASDDTAIAIAIAVSTDRARG